MIKIIMKSVDVLDSKIEEVRNGNNPCSNAKYDKTNGLMSGSKITNGYEVKEDRDTLKNVCGSKRLSTDFSRDEATAVKKNKDGGPKPFNSGKTEGGSASSVNRPNDSTSSCSGNGNLSGRLDSNHATGVSTKSIPSKNKCENSMDSTERFQVVDESFAASKMARDGSGKKTEDLSIENPSAKKVDGKCSSMTVGNSKEVSKLNGGHYSKRVSDCILKKDEELLDKTKSQSVEVQLPNEKISTNKISNELEKSDAVAVSTVGTVENREKDVGKSNNIGELKLEVPVKKSTSSDEIKQNDKSISKPHVADSKNECGRQKLREETKIDEFGKKTPMLILKPDKQKGTDRKESQGHGKIISQGASPVTSKESVLESKIVTGKEQNKPKETEVQKRQVSENNKFSCSSKSSSESILKSVGEVTINGKRDKLEGKDAKTTQQPDITSKGDSRGSENLNNKVSVNEKQGQEKEDKKTQEVENKNFSKSKLKPIGQSHLKDGATLTEKQDKPGGKVMKDSSVSEKKASSKSELNRTSDSNHKNDVTVTEKQDKAGEIQEEGKITQVLEKKTSLKSELKPTGESNLKNGVTVTKKHDKPREKEDKDKQDMKNDFSSKCELETTGESSKNDTKFINKQNKAKEKEVENKQELENKTSNVAGGSNLKHDGMLTEKQDEYNENGVKIIQEFGEAASSKCEQKLTDDSNLKNDMKVTEKQSELKEKDLVSTQQFEKTICTDDSKSDVDASLKHDVLADSKSIRPQSETGEKESRKNSLAALSCDNVKKCEKSILKIFSSDKFISDTKKDQGKLEEKKIKVSERNTSSISSNQLITKTIEKSIMTPDVDEIVSATKKEECKPNESGEKIKQKSVENIPRNETSNNIEDVSTKSGVNSVVKSTSLEDTLDEQVTDAPNQDSKIEDEGESNKMESKDIDGSSSKEGDDELVDGTEKIQEQSSDGSSDPVVTNDDSEVTFVEETVTKNFDPMDVDTVGVSDDSEIESLNLELSSENAEEAEESNVIEDVELAAKGDIKSNQDGDLVTADTYNVSEARDTIQRVDESSGRSDIQAVSSPIADFQIGQKRPAKYDEDNVKRLKTDENLSPVEDDCSKKRISSSLDDNVCVSEQKRKRTESGHEDKDSNGDSKSNVKSDSSIKSENSTKLNIENSSNASEDKTKSSVKSSLEFESVSESSEPLIRTSSASVCKNSIKNELLNVDSDISNRSDSGSNTSFQRDNTERERASLKSEVSTNTALLKESLKRMKKSDLEKLVMMKMAESLCYKSEIGDLRMKYQAAKESIDRWRRRCNYYEKVKTELSMTMNKYLKEVEACKNSEKGIEYAIPMKFTRSVGLQVAAPLLNQKRHHDNRGGPLQKSKQLQELLQQQTYKQQQQNKEQQQEKDQQEKEQFLKEQLQKDKESSQISKSAVPKVTTNVRSSTPRRMVSSKPTQTAPSTQVVARAPTSPTIFQKSPQRSAAAATTSSSPSVTSAPATASGPGPVPVAITASKVAASLSTPSSSSSLEVIDLTDKDERSRGLQGTQKPPASYQLVRLPSGKSTITSPANGQRAYLVPSSAVQGNPRQLLIATTVGHNQIPIGAAVVTAAGRNNTVALPPNTVFVKNLQNPTENIVVRSNSVIQRPIQTVKVTQCATHPAPLPPCPPAIHQSGWLLAPPRPQLVVRKTPNGAGIMLSWTLGLNKTYEEIASYQLYAYQEGTAPPNSSLWKKVGDVKALPLPMACTLTQFVEGHKYHFAVRAVDVHSRVGHFSGPSTITLN